MNASPQVMVMRSALIDHFNRQFATLDSLFDRVNDEAWRCEDQRLKGVWQWMTHTLETIEFYLSDKSPDKFDWGKRFNVDWEDPRPQTMPSTQDMGQYLHDVQQHVIERLESKSEEDFTAPLTVHEWTGTTYMGKMLYVLRHTQQHIGDMNRVLAFHGCDAMTWH